MKAVQAMIANEIQLEESSLSPTPGLSSGLHVLLPEEGRKERRSFPTAQYLDAVERRIAAERPSYGNKADGRGSPLKRAQNTPFNRKRMVMIFHYLNWIRPSLSKEGHHQGIFHARGTSSAVRALGGRYDLPVVCGLDRWCYLFQRARCLFRGSGQGTHSIREPYQRVQSCQ